MVQNLQFYPIWCFKINTTVRYFLQSIIQIKNYLEVIIILIFQFKKIKWYIIPYHLEIFRTISIKQNYFWRILLMLILVLIVYNIKLVYMHDVSRNSWNLMCISWCHTRLRKTGYNTYLKTGDCITLNISKTNYIYMLLL